ncbi:hypothetical protein QAD02_006592 [Eretmocerus hayati]|uniref:Uncharacterized protein n=1 Tax=Eretmocerus hayati TaxID=131215 RepID=A0ACC2N197_9HYME|nr:hypothetical protein QAD02_006592 [Eretmocerus hayati]
MVRMIQTGCLTLIIIQVQQQQCVAWLPLVIKSYFDQARRLYDDITGPGKACLALQGSYSIGSNADLMSKLQYLSTDFQDISEKLFDRMDMLSDELTQKTDQLFEMVNEISRQYDRYLKYIQYSDGNDLNNLKEFARKITSDGHGEVKSLIPRMHEKLRDAGIRENSIVHLLSKKSSELVCKGMHQTSQQLIKFFYELVTITSIKGLSAILYGYQVKRKLQENGSIDSGDMSEPIQGFPSKMEEAEMAEIKGLINETYERVNEVMSTASREIWRCNPPVQEKDITYSKLDDIFQGYLLLQTDTHLDFMKLWLSNTKCRSMKPTSLKCLSKGCREVPEDQRCRGRIRDCRSLDKDMSVCQSPRGSSRRYDSIKLGSSLKTIGPEEKFCVDPVVYRSALLYGDYCMCNCESEKREKTRYFSLQDVTSDVSENKVVTGARLWKRGFVFHIQIQQGTLGPNGSIIEERSEWVDIPEMSNSTLFSSEVSVFHHDLETSFWKPRGEDPYPYVDWTDFRKNKLVYAITYDTSYIYLDDLKTSPNEVMTGLRFQQIDKDLRLEIQKTSYDYATGTLDSASSSWFSNPITRKQRSEKKFDRADDPLKIGGSEEMSESGTYVRFTMTDVESDLGQNTVPYIDLQDVAPNPLLPLAGAGLYLRGKAGSGGFLALKLVHIDFSQYLEKIN